MRVCVRIGAVSVVSAGVLGLASLAGCSEGAEPASADRSAGRWLDRSDDNASLGASADAAPDTEPPYVPVVSPSRSEVALTDLPFVVVSNGYGPAEKDRSNGEDAEGDGARLSLGGTIYERGVGVHAASEITVALDGKYERFVSDVGIDDEITVDLATAVFRVLVDDKQVFESPVMRRASAPVTVSVPVLGAQKLTLVVTDGGDGFAADHGDWAGARLVVK